MEKRMSLIEEKGLENNRSKGRIKVISNMVSRPVYSRNNQFAGSYYKLKDSDWPFSDPLDLRQLRQAHGSLVFVSDLLRVMESDCQEYSHDMSEKQSQENLYFLNVGRTIITSAYICKEIVTTAARISSLGGRLVVMISGGVISEPRLLSSFFRNYAALIDEGVTLGMQFDAYINDPQLPGFVLKSLRFVCLNPFAVGMPRGPDNVSYPDVMYAGEVVREIHNRLDVKIVATQIVTSWQERVVKSLPIHYMLGSFFGGYKELVRVQR